MKRKLGLLGFCVAAVLLMGAVAVETVDQLYIQPRTVSSWGELVQDYLVYRQQWGPMAPPVSYSDALADINSGNWSFLAKDWAFKSTDGTYYVPKTSKLAKLKFPLVVRVYEDLQRGEIIVLSSADGRNFKGEALFDPPEFLPYEKDFPLDRYAFDELAPRRIVYEVVLKAEADAWTDLVSLRSTSVETMALMDGSEMMTMQSVPAEHANELWLSLETQTNGINFNVFAPEGFTNRVEVYSCADLVSNVWTIAAQNLYPSGTNPAVAAVDGFDVRFFRAGNMDVDSDHDGLPDAREVVVHKTYPDDPDSDGDTLTDGEEIAEYGLSPLSGDTNGDDVPDAIDAHMQGTTGEDGLLILLPSGQYRHITESGLQLNDYGAYGE